MYGTDLTFERIQPTYEVDDDTGRRVYRNRPSRHVTERRAIARSAGWRR